MAYIAEIIRKRVVARNVNVIPVSAYLNQIPEMSLTLVIKALAVNSDQRKQVAVGSRIALAYAFTRNKNIISRKGLIILVFVFTAQSYPVVERKRFLQIGHRGIYTLYIAFSG